MRKPVIAGNWKMHMTISEGLKFIEDLKSYNLSDEVDAVICAPFTLLKDLVLAAKGSNIKIGAQNMHYEDKGAYTGEVSSDMLKEIGVEYVIVGHSERRQYFADTNETVNKKVIKALSAGLTPIMCCGESLEERQAEKTFDKVKEQTIEGFKNVSPSDAKKVIVAYEPIWAIGTGKTASSEDANEVVSYIRRVLNDMYSEDVAEGIIIQYGGSVKPDNVAELMGMSDIDGALVGGASLKSDDFVKLINY